MTAVFVEQLDDEIRVTDGRTFAGHNGREVLERAFVVDGLECLHGFLGADMDLIREARGHAEEEDREQGNDGCRKEGRECRREPERGSLQHGGAPRHGPSWRL